MRYFINTVNVLIIILIAYSSFISEQHLVYAQESSNQKQQAIKRGLRLFKTGEIDASQAVFEKILKHDNKTLIAKEMLAIIAYRKGNHDKSEKLAKICLEQNRKSAKAHLVLAGVYREKGNILASRDHLRKSKKFASSREREMVSDYLQDDTRNLLDKVEKTSIKRGDLSTKIPEAGKVPYIAIFAFEDYDQEEDQSGLGRSFSEMLTTALIQTNRYQVLERSQLDKILQEQALGLSGAIDEKTAVDVGEILGIDAVVVGSSRFIEDQIEIDARIVDAQSGKAHIAASVSVEDESDLREASTELAKKLAAGSELIPIQRDDTETEN